MSLTPLQTLLADADRLQASSPCETRAQSTCHNECEWRRGALYGGACVDADVFSMFVDRLCSLDAGVTDADAMEFAQSMDYAPRDFGVSGWDGVTTRDVCARLNSDAERIQSVVDSAQPWRELGMPRGTYERLLRYAQRRYGSGSTLMGIVRAVRSVLPSASAMGTAAAITTLAMLTLPQSSYAPRDEQVAALAAVPRSVRTVPAETYAVETMLPRNPAILDPRMATNSILDDLAGGEPESFPVAGLPVDATGNSILNKLADSGLPSAAVKPLSALTTAAALEASVQGTVEVLGAATQCAQGTALEKDWLSGVVAGLEELPPDADLTQFADFRNWGLLPGQQLSYGGAFGIPDLTHHAIYVGDGVVLEVTAGPKACKRVARATLIPMKDQIVGLSTLVNFAQRAQKKNSDVHIIVTPEDSQPATAIERLQRAHTVVGCWDYDALINNCQSAANFISFGLNATAQGDAILRGARVVVLTATLLGGLLKVWRRTPRRGQATGAGQ